MAERIFKNSNELSLHIESIVIEKKLNHMEAILYYCEQNFIDPEDIVPQINKNLKQKIELNMIEANMLPKSGRLDI